MRIAFTHNVQIGPSEAEAEFDSPETIAMICASLRRLGHEVTPIDVALPLEQVVSRLRESRAQLVFNTAEGTRGKFREAFHPALFEQLELPYVGSDAFVCALTLDKYLSKQLVAAHGVPTPRSFLVQNEEEIGYIRVPLPAIVKPNFEGSSKGISVDSIVSDREALRDRTIALLASYPEGVLVEAYVDGVDVVVPFIEGTSPETGGVLEPASYRYRAAFAERKYRIYDGLMKQSGFDGLEVVCPAEVEPGVRERLIFLARQVYRILGIRDLGRIDFRIDGAGTPQFIEVNALPSLEEGASMYLSGERHGVSGVDQVLDAVIQSAVRRHGMVGSLQRASVA